MSAYILPLDSDDVLHPDMLKKTVEFLESHPQIAIVYTDLIHFGAAQKHVVAKEYDFQSLKYANQLNYCSIYRREVWEKVGGYNTNMTWGYEDWDFWIGAGELGYVAQHLPEALLFYRVKSESMFKKALEHDAELKAQIIMNHPQLYNEQERLLARKGLSKFETKALLVSVIVAKNLKGIVRYGIGVDNIDLGVAKEKNISIVNVPDYCISTVADYAFALLLALNSKLIKADKIVRLGNWKSWTSPSPEIKGLDCEGKQLGLIGMGKIGKALQKIVPEQTLLKKETNRLVKNFAIAGIFLCILVIVIYGITRGNWIEGFLAGVSLSMAIIPEEFPVVLMIFMSLGAWRMSKRQVLTRNTASIEMLGAATVLCVDKTGTLTQNKMILSSLFCDNQFYDWRGRNDLFGYTLQHTEVGIADQIAAAATLLLGQAAESIPAVIVRGASFDRREGSAGEINRPAEMDLFP